MEGNCQKANLYSTLKGDEDQPHQTQPFCLVFRHTPPFTVLTRPQWQMTPVCCGFVCHCRQGPSEPPR
ncbi:hypothetical protein PsYK624_136050 [Phanerochaete sordida]|uniref:Uncharacterized protein n=1 Tax=Phanerochaete sordida TaxID=48140 RepID=A0A9P3GLY9_9APHY|nr:hypothetical protein PsYK624_136050 [Phanerochaete sordida]